MCQGLTESYSGLLAIRFLMGVVETGLPAGATLIITSYYRKKELSLRFSLFMSAGVLGACFSGVRYLCPFMIVLIIKVTCVRYYRY